METNFEKIRKDYRIKLTEDLSIATVDTLGTIGIGYLISRKFDIGFVKTILGLFALSIPVHIIFEKDTPMTKFFLEL